MDMPPLVRLPIHGFVVDDIKIYPIRYCWFQTDVACGVYLESGIYYDYKWFRIPCVASPPVKMQNVLNQAVYLLGKHDSCTCLFPHQIAQVVCRDGFSRFYSRISNYHKMCENNDLIFYYAKVAMNAVTRINKLSYQYVINLRATLDLIDLPRSKNLPLSPSLETYIKAGGIYDY